MFEKLPCCLAACFIDQLCDSKLARPINADKETQLAFAGLHLRDAPSFASKHALPGNGYEKPDGIAFELLSLWVVTLDILQTRYPMPLPATMERRLGQIAGSTAEGHRDNHPVVAGFA